MGAGAAPTKTVASGVASLLRETGRLVVSSRLSSFILLVFYFIVPVFVSINVFVFIEVSTSNIFFSKKK